MTKFVTVGTLMIILAVWTEFAPALIKSVAGIPPFDVHGVPALPLELLLNCGTTVIPDGW